MSTAEEDTRHESLRALLGDEEYIQALRRQVREARAELEACRRRDTQRGEYLESEHGQGDALMLFSADGNLAWRSMAAPGKDFAEDIAGIRGPIARIELLRPAQGKGSP